jgi:hypothetical protein
VPLFQRTSPDFLEEANMKFITCRYRAGEAIVCDGEVCVYVGLCVCMYMKFIPCRYRAGEAIVCDGDVCM